MSKVFISHSSKDQKVARAICAALENRGLPCWLAGRNVGPGENFQESIVRAIRSAKVMVLVFSDSANGSAEITKELALASQHRLIVIPARVEDVVPSEALAYELATRQWIDLFQDWEDAVERLATSVGSVVPVEAAAAHGGDAAASAAPGHAHTPPPAGARARTMSPAAGAMLSFNTNLVGAYLVGASLFLTALVLVFLFKNNFAGAFAALVAALPVGAVGHRTFDKDESVRMFGLAIGIIGLLAVGAVNVSPQFYRIGILDEPSVQNGSLLMAILFLSSALFYGSEWKKLTGSSWSPNKPTETILKLILHPWLSGLTFVSLLLFWSATWEILYRLTESVAALLALIACHLGVAVYGFIHFRKDLRKPTEIPTRNAPSQNVPPQV